MFSAGRKLHLLVISIQVYVGLQVHILGVIVNTVVQSAAALLHLHPLVALQLDSKPRQCRILSQGDDLFWMRHLMPSFRVTHDCHPQQQQHNGLHTISQKRFLTVMAARCNDKQAPVMRHDTSGGNEEMSRHYSRQREHKELRLITATVNRAH